MDAELALFEAEIQKLSAVAAPPASAATTASAASPPATRTVPIGATVGSAPVKYAAAAPAAQAPVAPDLRTVPNADLGPPRQHNPAAAPAPPQGQPQPPAAPITSFPRSAHAPADMPQGALAQQMMGQRPDGSTSKRKKANRQAAGESWYDPSLDEWPQDDHRIFVGDLGNEVTDETLTLAFKHYKSFNKAKVIRERWNNKTKGYGFVSFSDSADMVACMKSMNGKYIGNRPCKLRKSTWQERATSGGKTMGPSKKSRGNKHMSKRFKGTMTH